MTKKKWYSLSTFEDKMWALTGLAIIAAIVLTIVSLLELCSEECAEGHKYKLFGLPFEAFGMVFFAGVAVVHILQKRFPQLWYLESLLFAGALGAELLFIFIQKYDIGQWCPVCLGIAFCIAVGFGAFTAGYARKFTALKRKGNKGEMMKTLRNGLTNTAAVFVGFFIAFMGVTKYDAMQAAQDSITSKLAFGDQDSDIEVYLFTDWACPACRKLEPEIKSMSKPVSKEAKLIFVDHVVHPETLNYIPFHLSFILHNKDNYFELRDMLTEMSEETGSPSEEEITAAAAKLGVNYNELNYSDIALAIKYYKTLGEKFKIKGTPTMVIINRDAKKGKKLSGNDEITQTNVMQAIGKLKSL